MTSPVARPRPASRADRRDDTGGGMRTDSPPRHERGRPSRSATGVVAEALHDAGSPVHLRATTLSARRSPNAFETAIFILRGPRLRALYELVPRDASPRIGPWARSSMASTQPRGLDRRAAPSSWRPRRCRPKDTSTCHRADSTREHPRPAHRRLARSDRQRSGDDRPPHRERPDLPACSAPSRARPRIVRLHGRGRVTPPGDDVFERVAARVPRPCRRARRDRRRCRWHRRSMRLRRPDHGVRRRPRRRDRGRQERRRTASTPIAFRRTRRSLDHLPGRVSTRVLTSPGPGVDVLSRRWPEFDRHPVAMSARSRRDRGRARAHGDPATLAVIDRIDQLDPSGVRRFAPSTTSRELSTPRPEQQRSLDARDGRRPRAASPAAMTAHQRREFVQRLARPPRHAPRPSRAPRRRRGPTGRRAAGAARSCAHTARRSPTGRGRAGARPSNAS